NGLYQFVWGTFCDWYLEFAKPILTGEAGPAQGETRAATSWGPGQALQLPHPPMPFLTEALWEPLGMGSDGPLITARWPDIAGLPRDPAASAEMEWAVDVIAQIRAVRSEMNVPAAAPLAARIADASAQTQGWLATHAEAIKRMARLGAIEPGAGSAQGNA